MSEYSRFCIQSSYEMLPCSASKLKYPQDELPCYDGRNKRCQFFVKYEYDMKLQKEFVCCKYLKVPADRTQMEFDFGRN